MTQQLDMLTMAGDSALRAENDRLTALVADLQGQLAARPVPTVEAAPAEPPCDHEVIKLRAEVSEWKAAAAEKQEEIDRLGKEADRLTKDFERTESRLESQLSDLEEDNRELQRKLDALYPESLAATMHYELTGQRLDWIPDIVERERWIAAAAEALPS